VRAANEGRTVIEMFPKEKITTDFETLADRVWDDRRSSPAAKAGFRIGARLVSPSAPDITAAIAAAHQGNRVVSELDRSSWSRPSRRR
jgi:hypothetical protein